MVEDSHLCFASSYSLRHNYNVVPKNMLRACISQPLYIKAVMCCCVTTVVSAISRARYFRV